MFDVTNDCEPWSPDYGSLPAFRLLRVAKTVARLVYSCGFHGSNGAILRFGETRCDGAQAAAHGAKILG